MSPRPYNLGKRREAIDQGRQQVLDAARSLLAEREGPAFTVDAVARRADVARATVYYQFGSKSGLLEAGCDHLAGPGGLGGLPAAFTDPDPAPVEAGESEATAPTWGSGKRIVFRFVFSYFFLYLMGT